jgi:hypothetical protein
VMMAYEDETMTVRETEYMSKRNKDTIYER